MTVLAAVCDCYVLKLLVSVCLAADLYIFGDGHGWLAYSRIGFQYDIADHVTDDDLGNAAERDSQRFLR